MTEGPLICGACLVGVELRIDAAWVSTVRCPKCGETDTLDKAFLESDGYLMAYVRGEASGASPRRFRFIPRGFTPIDFR